MDTADDILDDAHDAVLSAVRTRLGDALSWDEAVDLTGAIMAVVINAVTAATWAERARPAAPNARPRRGPPGRTRSPHRPEPQGGDAVSQQSSIEWTDGTWNFVVGCDKLSPSCAGCYAVKDALRMAGNPHPRVAAANRGLALRQANGVLNWTGAVRLLPERLALPFGWPTPKKVFVNSLSDLFHEQVPLAFIRRAFAVMAATPWHTYQVLTKRAERLEELAPHLDWPGNVWMGVSVESQPYATRVDHLRRTGARVKFLSVEPLLGPVTLDLSGVDWVITGGESGPRARPFDPAWALAVRDQCRAAGARFFHKQNGGRNKMATGRLLGGRTYDELPEVVAVPVPPARDRRRLAAGFGPATPAGRASLSLLPDPF